MLVDGAQVVCTPGGEQGTIAALNKADGKTLWQSKGIEAGAHDTSSIIPATINAEKQYVQLTMQSVFAVSSKDGAVLWRVSFPGKDRRDRNANCEGQFSLVTTGYQIGCKLLEIKPGNMANEVYANKNMTNHHGGVILIGDHLYGLASDGVGWTCVEFKSGNQVWARKVR